MSAAKSAVIFKWTVTVFSVYLKLLFLIKLPGIPTSNHPDHCIFALSVLIYPSKSRILATRMISRE